MNQKKKKNILRQAKEEVLQLENCPKHGEKLIHKWLSRKDQEESKFEPSDLTSDIEFNSIDGELVSWWTQIWGAFCPECLKENKPDFHPKILFKDYEHEDIPYQEEKQKYQKERELVEKIATSLLPKQNLKIRFVQTYGAGSMEAYGLAMEFENPLKKEVDNLCVCFPIELLIEKEKNNPGFFCEAVAHELAHACQEVFQNPQHSDTLFSCSCQKLSFNSSIPSPYAHEGPGHDKIWHDKFDEFRERIKNEKLAADSEYSSLGREFILKEDDNDTVLSPEDKRLRVNKISLDYLEEAEKNRKESESKTQSEQKTQRESKNTENNKTAWIIFAILGIMFLFFLIYWSWKRKTKNQRK